MPHFTSYDGTTLFYEVTGTGPALLCLAGGPGADVRDLGSLGGLDAFRTLIMLDGRAAGRSETPADRAGCAFTAQARDLEELRGRLGIEHLDVLAHSAGTLTAQAFAADHPENTGRLVLVTPAGLVSREADEPDVAAIRARRAADPGTAEAVAAGAEPWHYGAWSEAARRHHEAGGDWPQPPSWLREAFYVRPASEAAAATEAARRAAVRCPVLVVAGAEDGVAGVDKPRHVASCYPAGRLEVLTGSGHWPWVDEPTAFRGLVTGFLAD
ncbi:alpha/beta hydrolase [Kitasatospora sp. NPDC004723]|uniref:alpha/beta fold hydrolase n=1 Tax=Kitasatospora sp. NPDC004723 TaxID=3154288 RepID=UPI0033B0DE7D